MALRVGSGGRPRTGRRSPALAGVFIAAGLISAAIIVSQPKAKPVVQNQAPIVAEFDAVELLVPVQPVSAGTKVKDIRLKSVSFPKHQVPADAINEISAFADAVAVAPLPAGLPLFPANFTTAGHASNPVLERIPPGMRAMTVRVDATSAVEGWAGSGSVVDVLLVEKNRTSVIAEKVKVLSAERSVSPVDGGAAPSVPSTVTLLVTQEQCLALNTAIPLGRIAFALRSNRDEQSWSETSFTAEQLKGEPSSEPSTVSGYVSAAGNAYALSNGKWIKSDVVPEGFLVNR